MDYSKIDTVIKNHHGDVGQLIGILQDVQKSFNYLPKSALDHVAKKLDIPEAQVYGVATFFKAFSLNPRGKHIVHVCMGTACHVRGAKRIFEDINRELKLGPDGGTTEDLRYTVEPVNCVGACALGPVLVFDGEYHGNATPEKSLKLFHNK